MALGADREVWPQAESHHSYPPLNVARVILLKKTAQKNFVVSRPARVRPLARYPDRQMLARRGLSVPLQHKR